MHRVLVHIFIFEPINFKQSTHHNFLQDTASPVLKGMIKTSKKQGRRRSISIRGVPYDAVRVFIRFLYSSR